MALKFLKSANVKNKTVFLRVDVNVPLDEHGNVADDFRIHAILQTIKFLQKQHCKIILCGHLGRPEGKRVKDLSLRPVAERLAKDLHYRFSEDPKTVPEYPPNDLIFLTGDVKTESVREFIQSLPAQHIVLLENIRFYPEEDKNDTYFGKLLAGLADVYVNDAFAVSHRKAASVVAIAKHIPGYVGLELEKELTALNRVLERPKKPFVVMMAGIKISDKEKTLEHLGKKADHVLVGGGIANVFFLAKDYEVGQSKVEAEGKQLAWQMAKNFKDKLVLPVDVVVANKAMDKSSIRVCSPHEVKSRELILDIGPKTILQFAKVLKTAQTIVWNGPLGNFEHKPFHTGTMALARIVGAVSKGKCFGVVGGGETVDAVREAHQADFIDHLSTGGGAMLEYLAGDKLPAIEALK